MEDVMKDKISILTALVVALAACASAPVRGYAQEKSPEHHHYILKDLGTLGGPTSLIFGLTGPMNNKGTVASCADTPAPNPNFANGNPYITPDPFIAHGVSSEKGVFVDLGTLPGGSNSCTQWINSLGWVVGGSENGEFDPLTGYPQVRAVLWKHGKIHDLGTLGGNESVAFAINDAGDVVGFASNKIPDSLNVDMFAFGATQTHAFLWKDGAMHDLGTLGGPDSIAFNVNERGQIAGNTFTSFTGNSVSPIPNAVPFLWENGKMINLGGFGGTYGAENDLNNRGQVVGFSFIAGDMGFHPFLWSQGKLFDLGTFGGTDGEAIGLNDAGDVVGYAEFPIPCPGCDSFGEEVFHAALWKYGRMIDIGPVEGDRCSAADSINSRGQVVGGSGICFGSVNAFLWEESGPAVDLNALVPTGSPLHLVEAISINDRGEIAGNGVLPNGDIHTFLLIPCDSDHSGMEGCNYNLVDEVTAAAQVRPAQIIQVPAASPATSSPTEILTRFRSLRTGRNRRFGTPQTSPK
jgi:probable HAF family extracellular repeat protein